jgi:two-component system, chemotaxis family, CheB/CheR fusion protein
MPRVTAEADPAFEELLQYLRASRGFDYTGYKRPGLIRRFEKRLDAVGAKSFGEYREYLEHHGEEFAQLFNTILINVTGFFRDEEAWNAVRDEVLPRILEYRTGGATIRAWSAGCATGEEAYTTAMLLAEALGEDAFRERVKIYATDVDEEALTQARGAVYAAKQVDQLPSALRERYFQQQNGAYAVRGEIRRAVIFGRNDLLQDPPISRVDFLVSRNTLMYFEPEAQQRILTNYSFALNRRGFLMVGKAEALQSRTNLFEPFDVRHRIFVRNPDFDGGPRLPRLPLREAQTASPSQDALRDASFDQGPVAQVVVDKSGRVASVNYAARALFGVKATDVGKPLQDLELSYRPVDLRSLIDEVENVHRPISAREIEWTAPGGQTRRLDVQVAPLTGAAGRHAGVSISFTDVSRYYSLAGELETVRRDLETAYEELQSTVEELETTNEELQSTNEELETTNEELQSTNEELETMNEELQSTNEELETTNEELQSTNEELETMNEELQSTNEELEAMNDELRDRTDEALQANAFLGSILWSVEQAVVVVDRQLCVTKWSRAATELWGPREEEVEGEHLLNLEIGIPVGELREPIRATLAGEPHPTVTLEGHDRRGRPLCCDVTFAQLRSALDEVEGVILVVSPADAGV